MARIGGLLVAFAVLVTGSSAFSAALEQDHDESIRQTLNNNDCGTRYYENDFPIESRLFEHPWLVRFGYKREGDVNYVFQGLLIHARYVLTTVHVARFEDYGQLTYARLGEYNSSTEPDCEIKSSENRRCAPKSQDILIDVVVVHPDYNMFEQSNDIALVKLRTTATMDGISVSPICLNQMREPESSFLLIASWCGRRETGLSTIPKQYYMDQISPQVCRDRMPGFTISLSNGMFCVLFAQKHTQPPVESIHEPNLRGGNGAPIFTVQGGNKIHLIGLLSYGPRYPAKLDQPYIITPVAPYYEWITETIQSDIEQQSYKTAV